MTDLISPSISTFEHEGTKIENPLINLFYVKLIKKIQEYSDSSTNFEGFPAIKFIFSDGNFATWVYQKDQLEYRDVDYNNLTETNDPKIRFI